MANLIVNVQFDRLVCYHHGQGGEAVKPHLWTIFFAIEGQHVHLTEQLELEGEAYFFLPFPFHGELGIPGVTNEEVAKIPSPINHHSRELVPIQGASPGLQLPGIFGAVAVLIEAQNAKRHGSSAGHDALTRVIRQAVNYTLNGYSFHAVEPEQSDLTGDGFESQLSRFVEDIERATKEAILGVQPFVCFLLDLPPQEGLLTGEVWTFSSADFREAAAVIEFSRCWSINPTLAWELIGYASAREKGRLAALMRETPGSD